MVAHVQHGYGMPVFVGRRMQRGHGLGGVFASLAKNILLPAVKNIGTALITSGLQKTTRAIEDVGQGKSIKTAFKDQFASAPGSIVRSGAKRAASVLNELAGVSTTKKHKVNIRPRKRTASVLNEFAGMPTTKKRRVHNKPRKHQKSRPRRKHDVFDTL